MPTSSTTPALAVAFVLPVITVLRWNLVGVVIGTLVVWGSLAIAEHVHLRA